MRIRRSRSSPTRELIPRDPAASFAAFRFTQSSFPFVWHYHPEAELTYIVKGSGLRFVGDSIEAFEPGDLILIGGNVPHTWQSTTQSIPRRADHVESIVIQFPEQFLGNAMELLPELRLIRHTLDDAARGLSVDDPALRHSIRMCMEAMLASPIESSERLTNLIRSLQLIADGRSHKKHKGKMRGSGKRFVRLVSASPRNDSRSADLATRRLDRVFQSLNESLDSGELLTQSTAAYQVEMSPASFSRFFHRKVGRTFAHYVKEWRVELACRALVQSEEPITKIAFDCGFNNLSNFNRAFRTVKRMTPREFRKLQ